MKQRKMSKLRNKRSDKDDSILVAAAKVYFAGQAAAPEAAHKKVKVQTYIMVLA